MIIELTDYCKKKINMVKWYKLVKSLKKVKEKQEYFEEKLAKIEQRTCTETTELREQMELLTQENGKFKVIFFFCKFLLSKIATN